MSIRDHAGKFIRDNAIAIVTMPC